MAQRQLRRGAGAQLAAAPKGQFASRPCKGEGWDPASQKHTKKVCMDCHTRQGDYRQISPGNAPPNLPHDVQDLQSRSVQIFFGEAPQSFYVVII